ncbi:MAG: hypothetical protein LBI56_00935 [Puniceicoccales bacterium]|jgi:hypothetical protein|nr:hypothetical protein [Puniceicoccales bacterium]
MFEDNRDRKLKKLLELKKFEKPTEGRWLEFDCAFENKLLYAIKDSRLRRFFVALAGFFACRRTLVFAGALIFLVVFSSGVKVNEQVRVLRAALRDSKEYVKFANDNMFVRGAEIDTDSGVRSISYANDGIKYVHDVLILSNSSSMLAKM